MKHTSVKLETPVEFINVKPLNPLISKCQIKVCYVGDEPNRNRSVITKEVATEMANSLPGSPIVGFYNEANEDFEEHNRVIDISNGKFEIKDTTRPYGFVDLNAKCWFQKFLDDGQTEHEYLMTEGYLWTGQYPECQRIISQGNNQSMELDERSLDATWSNDDNGKPQFFIINEAIISKLCILGDDCEPCFEGSQITNVQFSFEDEFKTQLFSMMNELKELLQEGGAKQVFNTYAVEIGDALWSALYSYIEATYPDSECKWCSRYSIEGVYEEEGQKFAVLQNRSDMKYYRMNFSINEASGLTADPTLIEVTKSYTPASEPQFAKADVDAFVEEYAKKKKEEEEKDKTEQGKDEKEETSKTEDNTEGDDSSEEDDEEDPEKKKKKKKEFSAEAEEETAPAEGENNAVKYSLEEIPEYTDLMAKFSDLETKYNALVTEKEELEAKIAPLTEFKNAAERKEKEAMIANFYMLSDEDKADVIANIDKYSLDDIEAKLSIICVRNKVSFDLEDNKDKGATTFNLNSDADESTPAWVKAAMNVAKTLK